MYHGLSCTSWIITPILVVLLSAVARQLASLLNDGLLMKETQYCFLIKHIICRYEITLDKRSLQDRIFTSELGRPKKG